MIEIDVNGETRRVAVEPVAGAPGRYRVSWDGTSRVFDARVVDHDSWSVLRIESADESHDIRLEETDRRGGLHVHVDGVLVPLRVETGRVNLTGRTGGGHASGGQHVVAPMPGKVVRVLVHPGDEVEAGQGVVVVEAMKMENQLTAPSAGRVAEVSVEEGVSVEAGRVLVVLE